jgi:Trp operon repressor
MDHSASQARETLAGFGKVNKATADSIATMEAEAKKLTKEYKSLSEEERNSAEVGVKKLRQIAELKTATSQFTNEVKNTSKAITASEGSYAQLSNGLNRMRTELKNMPGAFDPATGALNKNNKEAVALSQRITQTDMTIKKIDATMGQFYRNVGNYTETTVSLRTQLRAVTQELAVMELEGKRGSEAYDVLVQKAGEMQHALSKTGEEIRRTGSDTRTIEGMVGVFQGIAGAAAIAEAATQLFGDENDDLVKGIQSLQIVQTAMMGIQSIANMFQKQSAAIIMIINLQEKIRTVQTQLQGAAESKNIVIRYAAIVAQKLLNAAMNANPAGILITALIALAGVIVLLSMRSKDAAKELETLNRIQNSLYESTYKEIELLKMAGDERTTAIQDQIKEAKAAGASQLELMNLEIEAADVRRKNASMIQSQFSRTKDDVDILTRQYARQREEVEKLELTTTSGNKKGNELLDQKKKATDLVFNRLKAVMAANNEFSDADLDLDNKKLERLRLLNEIDLRDKKATIDSKLAKSKEESLTEFNLKVQLMENEKAKTLLNVDLTEKERQAIIDKYAREESDLRKEFAEKQKENALNADIAYTEGRLALAVKGSDEEYSLKEELITKQYNLDVASVTFSIHNEELRKAKLKELYDKQLADKRDLEKEKRLAELNRANDKATGGENLEIIKNQEIIASSHSTFKEINDARLANEQLVMQGISREMAFNEQKYKEGLITHDEYEKRKTELTIEGENIRWQKTQEIAEREKELKQAELQVITECISAANSIYSDQIDVRIAQINQEKDIAIKAAGDNANAKARIEEEFNRRIAREKRRQAKADKIASLAQIAINTAVGVTQTIDKWGMPLAIPFIAAAIAIGAIQAAIVAAKPLPQYRRGIKSAPEGPAIINDEPGPVYREMIVRDNKAYLPGKRNQLVYLKRGDKVIKAAETRGILTKQSLELDRLIQEQALNDSLAIKLESGRKLEIMQNMAGAMQGIKIDEKSIVDGIGRHLSNLPIEQHSWDERGYRRSTRKGNTTIVNLNKRNSL